MSTLTLLQLLDKILDAEMSKSKQSFYLVVSIVCRYTCSLLYLIKRNQCATTTITMKFKITQDALDEWFAHEHLKNSLSTIWCVCVTHAF